MQDFVEFCGKILLNPVSVYVMFLVVTSKTIYIEMGNTIMKKMYKILGFLGLLFMVLEMGVQGKNCSAEEKPIEFSMAKDGITYSYKVTGNWEGGYIAEFKIKNGTEQAIDDWTIRMNYDDTITNIWNAEILACDESVYTIGNAGWNQRLEAGGEVNFGVQAEYTQEMHTPNGFVFLDDYTGVEDDEVCGEASVFVEAEADDFETEQEYEEYLKENKNAYENILQNPLKARAAIRTVTLAKNGQQYTLKGIRNRAIQNFYVASNYIYITQKGPENEDGTKGSVYLSRCKLKGKTATYIDEMQLIGVGHGQTLEMYKYKGETYFLFACGENKVGSTCWSTQIGRIQYKANTKLKNKDIKRFTYLAYANKSAKSFGALHRLDAALSSDKKTILIWKHNGTNQQFSGFNFDTFNAVLSASKSTSVSFKGNTKMKKACTFTFDDKNKNLGLPSSVQGVEISNKSDGLHSIYICSGTENKDGDRLSISRFNSAGVKKSKRYISHKFGKHMEVEGIHISGDNLQIGLCSTKKGDKSIQYIFAVSKSKLK